MSDNVTISIQARAYGPTGTANRVHAEVKALLELLGYSLDGPMYVRVENEECDRCGRVETCNCDIPYPT